MEELKLDVDLQIIMRVFTKYWVVILVCAVLGGFTGWVFSKWVFKAVYESSVTIYAFDANDNPTIGAIKYQDIEVNSRLVNDYREIITSYKVQDLVFTRLQGIFPELLRSEYTVEASLQRNTRIIKITATAPTPKLAQIAANTSSEVFDSVVQDVMRIKNIKVIDAARIPQNKLKPKMGLNIILGTFIGLFLALLTVFFKELLDWTIKNPEEITERLGKNVICSIPDAELGDAEKDCRIFTNDNGHSAISEAFKILRTNVEFAVPGKKNARIIMFTSALPGEGKTTITTNLALSMSESGKKVLLLDCDLRKPALHKSFSLENSKGLVSLLVGTSTVNDVLHKNVMNHTLDLISSGPIPPNPTELLMSESFKQMLSDLSNDYEYIFIDAPPTLNMADTTIIGHIVDATIFVITAGKTRIELIRRSIKQLHQTNVDVAGILLNRFNPKTEKFGYYHYHYHYKSNTINKS